MKMCCSIKKIEYHEHNFHMYVVYLKRKYMCLCSYIFLRVEKNWANTAISTTLD